MPSGCLLLLRQQGADFPSFSRALVLRAFPRCLPRAPHPTPCPCPDTEGTSSVCLHHEVAPQRRGTGIRGLIYRHRSPQRRNGRKTPRNWERKGLKSHEIEGQLPSCPGGALQGGVRYTRRGSTLPSQDPLPSAAAQAREHSTRPSLPGPSDAHTEPSHYRRMR